MTCRFTGLKNKEVINIKDGTLIGCVDDVEIDTVNAQVCAIVVFGHLRWFGLLGREDDIVIGWDKVEIVGEDAILVCFDGFKRLERRMRRGLFRSLFNA